MSTVDVAMATIHLLVGALWVGSVVFFAGVVLPNARDGALDADPVERMVGSLVTWSRGAAVVMLLTGGHLAGTRYTVETLTGTTNGYLVVGMVVLWLALAGLVEVGRSRLVDGVSRKKVREPARDALGLFRGASVVGLALLVTAGLLLS